MNINPKAKRILCFGDSNTWGEIPKGQRYPIDNRWTGLLQKYLGNAFEVVEEGLCARTTDIDDPKEAGRNGLTYLAPCLRSHNPLDVVILMLGTCDLKERYRRTPERIFKGIENLVKAVLKISWNKKLLPAKIILLSPPLLIESINQDKYRGCEAKAKFLGKGYQEIANKYKLLFIDLVNEIEPSKTDGAHLEPEAHEKIAKLLTSEINSLLKD